MLTSLLCLSVVFNCLPLHCHDTQAMLTYPTHNLWESFAPGELLKLLEEHTSPQTQLNIAQRRVDTAQEGSSDTPVSVITVQPLHKQHRRAANTYSTEDHLNPLSASEEYSYDQAYDQFVRQYFTDKIAENSAALNDATQETADSAESVELSPQVEDVNASLELEPRTQESQNKAKQKHSHQKIAPKCRKIRRDKHQTCLLCENNKTGEKSESCAWARESEPKRYTFERERRYKKQRELQERQTTSGKNDNEPQSNSGERSIESQEHLEGSTIKRQDTNAEAATSSTCTKRTMDGKVCYRCHDSDGWNTQCHPDNTATLKGQKNEKSNDNTHKRQQTQQRIYKRTISYSYEKGTNGSALITQSNEPNNAPAPLPKNETLVVPQSQEKFYVKVVKQNSTLDE